MNDIEILEMFLFFYIVGMLLYFDKDNLKEIIIFDIQWFFNVFQCIIVFYVDQKDFDIDCEFFKNMGELDDKKLEEFWKGEKNEGYIKYKEKILLYME